MTGSRYSRRETKRPGRRPGAAAFTELEIMVVCAILGLLMLFAVPSWIRSRRRTRDAVFVNKLRLCYDAFNQYAMQQRGFPSSAPPSVVPAGMAEYMPRRLDWTGPTPIGGAWEWSRADNPGERLFDCCRAGISIVGPTRTSKDMQAIDAIVDDGDLETGQFRRRDGGYVYIVE